MSTAESEQPQPHQPQREQPQPEHPEPNGFVTVARIGEMNEGEGRTVEVGDRLVAVFLHGGRYWAIDDLCPHQGASLGAGCVDDHGAVACPWHGWRFGVADGKWCDNPRLGVDRFPIRIVGDEVQVSATPLPDDAASAG